MNDYFLKAADEHQMRAALEAAGILDAEGMVCAGCALDVIGLINKPTGVVLRGEDGEYLEMAAIDGYHANLRGDLTPEQMELLPIIEAPSTPVRVWA